MENYETLQFFEETLRHMKSVFRADPVAVAHDLHPGYLSSQWALGRGREGDDGKGEIPAFGIQHHYAHIASVMAEKGLQEKVIERVGDNRPIPVDVRIITATNRNLKELVDKGVFRSDFYYRINVLPVELPPLRRRPEDIPLLAEMFFHHLQLKSDKKILGISPEAMQFLVRYPWPGNVRELKSAFEYAFVTCSGSHIEPQHLPPDLAMPAATTPVMTTPLSTDERKKRQLQDALAQAGGNQSLAAKILGVSRVTVWNRMHRYGLLRGD